jgi:hypothetical protein
MYGVCGIIGVVEPGPPKSNRLDAAELEVQCDTRNDDIKLSLLVARERLSDLVFLAEPSVEVGAVDRRGLPGRALVLVLLLPDPGFLLGW